MRRVFYLMVLIGFISACQSGKKANTAFMPIRVDTLVFKREGPSELINIDASLKCSIDISYLRLSGGNDSVVLRINKFMASLPIKRVSELITLDENVNTPKNLEEAANDFFASFERQYKESPEEHNAGYFYEAGGDTVLITPNVIALDFHEFMYIGGAHPDRVVSYYNFDANTGKLLKLTDIVKDTVVFLKIAEQKFRESETKEAKENNRKFSMDDYFFEDDKFILPKNISIRKEGLLFLYNPSEIALQARQHIIFNISWQELKGIVVEKYAGK